tara:strand:+ start:967 stop:1152 length:186 start_codon:yes stop_codon:yes gene_type:complete
VVVDTQTLMKMVMRWKFNQFLGFNTTINRTLQKAEIVKGDRTVHMVRPMTLLTSDSQSIAI